MSLLKLKGRIVEKGFTQTAIAKKLNLSTQSFNAKVNGRAVFNINEVKKLTNILAIESVEEFFLSD